MKNESSKNDFKLAMKEEGIQPSNQKSLVQPQHISKNRFSASSALQEPLEVAETTDFFGIDDRLFYKTSHTSDVLLKRIKQGKVTPEAMLDLHGMTLKDSEKAMFHFLKQAETHGWEVIKIIHGKGKQTPYHYPVLKNQVYRWLKGAKIVNAFCSAHEKHGGNGAVYVLLNTEVDN